MRVAIPFWQDRVSPVFDEASRILLVDISGNKEQRRKEEYLPTQNPLERARLLPMLGVDLLVCGMISQIQQTAISAAGIRIVPCICGSTTEVIAALLEDQIECSELRMPGCRNQKKIQRHQRKIDSE